MKRKKNKTKKYSTTLILSTLASAALSAAFSTVVDALRNAKSGITGKYFFITISCLTLAQTPVKKTMHSSFHCVMYAIYTNCAYHQNLIVHAVVCLLKVGGFSMSAAEGGNDMADV